MSEVRIDLGRLLQRRELPDAGIDAMEARIVVVQEVPLKAEVRFYAVRGDDRQRLPQHEVMKMLCTHFTQKPVTELSAVELHFEVLALRAVSARMWPIYEAAKKWRVEHNEDHNGCAATANLYAAVDAAVAAEEVK